MIKDFTQSYLLILVFNEASLYFLLCVYILHSLYTPDILIAFSRNERTHPNFVSQEREMEIFCEDCKLAAPVGFFGGFGPSFRVHGVKSTRAAKNA